PTRTRARDHDRPRCARDGELTAAHKSQLWRHAMKVIRSTEGAAVDRSGAAIFEGQVTGRTMLEAGDSTDFNASIVQFSPGARTRLHRHASDQLLYIVAGIGQVG